MPPQAKLAANDYEGALYAVDYLNSVVTGRFNETARGAYAQL